MGLVYVADWGNNLVKIYAPDGALVRPSTATPTSRSGPSSTWQPTPRPPPLREQAAHPEQENGSGGRPASSWTPPAGSTWWRAAATACRSTRSDRVTWVRGR